MSSFFAMMYAAGRGADERAGRGEPETIPWIAESRADGGGYPALSTDRRDGVAVGPAGGRDGAGRHRLAECGVARRGSGTRVVAAEPGDRGKGGSVHGRGVGIAAYADVRAADGRGGADRRQPCAARRVRSDPVAVGRAVADAVKHLVALSVAAEVLVFMVVGPRLLAAVAGVVRWLDGGGDRAVPGDGAGRATARIDVGVVASGVIGRVVPAALAATAAVVTLASGHLYGWFGAGHFGRWLGSARWRSRSRPGCERRRSGRRAGSVAAGLHEDRPCGRRGCATSHVERANWSSWIPPEIRTRRSRSALCDGLTRRKSLINTVRARGGVA